MKKQWISLPVLVSAMAVPVFASAQSTTTLSRAQVKAELVQLERYGYKQSGDANRYPDNIQAAERHLNEDRAEAEDSYSDHAAGTTDSGSRTSNEGGRS